MRLMVIEKKMVYQMVVHVYMCHGMHVLCHQQSDQAYVLATLKAGII